MSENRPPIPMSLQREVRVEAGHRCAIPTCRGTSALEIAHIEPWAQVRTHEFGNLILLCAVCHTRYDNGEIDRPAMRHYNSNLSVVNHRYGDIERRILEFFATQPGGDHLELSYIDDLQLIYLFTDGYLQKLPARAGTIVIMNRPVAATYRLTTAGREFVTRWAEGRDLSAFSAMAAEHDSDIAVGASRAR